MIGLALAASVCLAVSESHRSPGPSSAPPKAEKLGDLEELRARGLMAEGEVHPTPQESALLKRARRAESAGALAMLRRRERSLKGLAVELKSGKHLLTKEGFERYLFLESQDAVAYFESKDVDAKWVFQLADMDGKPLFNGGGLLTDAGEGLYLRASAGKAAYWRAPTGEVFGTRPPPK